MLQSAGTHLKSPQRTSDRKAGADRLTSLTCMAAVCPGKAAWIYKRYLTLDLGVKRLKKAHRHCCAKGPITMRVCGVSFAQPYHVSRARSGVNAGKFNKFVRGEFPSRSAPCNSFPSVMKFHGAAHARGTPRKQIAPMARIGRLRPIIGLKVAQTFGVLPYES